VSDVDEHEGAVGGADTDHALADRAGAAVVLQHHVHAKAGIEATAQIGSCQIGEHRVGQQAAVAGEIAGQRDADTEQAFSR